MPFTRFLPQPRQVLKSVPVTREYLEKIEGRTMRQTEDLPNGRLVDQSAVLKAVKARLGRRGR